MPKLDKQIFFTITHSEHEMEAAIKESMVVHALVVKQVLTMEEEKKPVEHSTEVNEILEEFRSIFLEDLPEGLPPHERYSAPHRSDSWCQFTQPSPL